MDIFSLFESAGTIFSLELMIHHVSSKRHRGFGSITFTSPEDANRAISLVKTSLLRFFV